jgi:hypothetical protein
MSPSPAMRTLAQVFPEDGIVVLESPSATPALRNQLRLGRPGSYYFSAGGGLGFGMPAAIGVQLACPDRPVVCVIGEGSAQYAVQSFWTAVAYRVPVTFLVLRNEEYAILKFFSLMEEVPGAPGLDLPALDIAAVAAGYGVNARRAATRGAGGASDRGAGPDRPERSRCGCPRHGALAPPGGHVLFTQCLTITIKAIRRYTPRSRPPTPRPTRRRRTRRDRRRGYRRPRDHAGLLPARPTVLLEAASSA